MQKINEIKRIKRLFKITLAVVLCFQMLLGQVQPVQAAEKNRVSDAKIKNLIAEIGKEKGVAKSKTFISSEGTSLCKYPKSILGYTNYCVLNCDSDKDNEVLVLVNEKGDYGANVYWLYLYDYNGKKLVQKDKISLGEISYCGEMRIRVFYSEKLSSYSVFSYNTSVGNYTGVRDFNGKIVKVKDELKSVEKFEWCNYVGWDGMNKIEKKLKKYGVTYINSCWYADYGDPKKAPKEYLLGKVKAEVVSGEAPSERVNQIKIYTEKQLGKKHKIS